MSKKTDDAFYDNLTLGLMKTLNNMPRVCNIGCEKRPPCEKAHVVNWEQRHSVIMPEDMKRFYLSTDGFVVQWSYQYAQNDVRRVGYIHFPHLVQITLLRENIDMIFSKQLDNISASNDGTGPRATPFKDLWGNDEPILTPKTKIFELSRVSENAKVCLVYESTSDVSPRIYLLETDCSRWQFLAESFSEYLRMSIGHMGLPFWELCFASCGLPPWVEQLFLLLAPHLIQEHQPRRSRVIKRIPEHPCNIIDPSIFRTKTTITTKPTTASLKHKGSVQKT